jgi:hypothetical protein
MVFGVHADMSALEELHSWYAKTCLLANVVGHLNMKNNTLRYKHNQASRMKP